jgi:hypothetical protein
MYPHERSLVEKHADQPFVLLGINSDEDRLELQEVIKKEKLDWRSWWDGSVDGPIHEQYQITSRPAIFVLDQQGIIRFKSTSADGLDEVIESLLK